ncbi:hypothetical protein M5K25_026761 [Dendrobium thyrsiflorum]|uniref:RING-type E3 ubiquitin transferase n=1 Tax=Dendrobium thyrsiflorum TaxID=117978 RepID=A0ABD0TYD6_DENTH
MDCRRRSVVDEDRSRRWVVDDGRYPWVVDEDRRQIGWEVDEDRRRRRWAIEEDRRRRRRAVDNDRRRRRWEIDGYPPLELPLKWRDPPPEYPPLDLPLKWRNPLPEHLIRNQSAACVRNSPPLRPHSVAHDYASASYCDLRFCTRLSSPARPAPAAASGVHSDLVEKGFVAVEDSKYEKDAVIEDSNREDEVIMATEEELIEETEVSYAQNEAESILEIEELNEGNDDRCSADTEDVDPLDSVVDATSSKAHLKEKLSAAEVVQKLDKVPAEVRTFHHLLESTKQEQERELYKARETGSLPRNDLIGRGKDKEFVMQWLRKPSNELPGTILYRNISLLSIVGHGGTGKTTLLQHVYKDEMTEEFDLKMSMKDARRTFDGMPDRNIVDKLLERLNVLPGDDFLSKEAQISLAVAGIAGAVTASVICSDPHHLKASFLRNNSDENGLATGDITLAADVYSFGIILLRLLTRKPALGIINHVQEAVSKEKLHSILDRSAGMWPHIQAKQLV